ncbi:DUF1311 domain-containing protein [Aggregatibacter actinomycetemcomitans]|uniref:lysozyme inhibitor LprI family protein n=1 Tax=Aggregatibacter actinomycetemcomitans TaxID=714 RepID=UPI00197BE111|nr:lysozyme inhibitor LprI family protein [Aggregatibacter actinomycetemcomitans]MBN6069728.1 DUF1311 domain-containing protein [Aggregatibacter actinomycetemcomitans]
MKKLLISLCSVILLTAASKNCDNIECHKDNIEKYKAELNKSFQELVKADENNITVDSFKESQILWNKFIKEDCKFMNSPMSMTQGEGYIVVYYECLEDYYSARIKQINKMISDIK